MFLVVVLVAFLPSHNADQQANLQWLEHALARATLHKLAISSSFLNGNATLWKDIYGSLEPEEACERLVLITGSYQGMRRSETDHEGLGELGTILPAGSHQKIIRHLSDLAGAVHIDTAAAALQFVRLRTSPATWVLWPGTCSLEVVSEREAVQLPNYGLRSYYSPHVSIHSGFMGVLSNQDFSRGHFSVAAVLATSTGFVVMRWLLTGYDTKLKVELVREEIGSKGEYRCTVLHIQDVSHGSQFDWQIPTFE